MDLNKPGNSFSNFDNGNRQPARLSPFFPLLFAVMLAIGVLLGYYIQPGSSGKYKGNDRMSYILSLIEKEYVDKVNPDDLTDKAITGMLAELDPHSVYLSAKDVRESNEELSGKFGGVGIQFVIQDDTLMVSHLVADGPSAKKGLLPFDRILAVDGKKFHNSKITNEQVLSTLRGDIGSVVKLKVYRPSTGETKEYKITRGIISVPSVEGVLLNTEAGLIRISQFGENTFSDFLKIARGLRAAGMKKMILDLRDNGGGYLQAAENMSDQFLKNKVKIVFTDGKNQGRFDYVATSAGEFESIPLVVMVNHNSASASEIVAGAIQDNDRGAIVGRRTFGKGLVQQQFGPFSDGSALRLTVSRYYTPTGRSIQRPYGQGIDYYHDGIDRYKNNEFYRPDSSIFVDSLKYKTINKKRTVYGGGGIMPDVFVPLDTMFNTVYYGQVLDKGAINSFAFRYVEKNGARLRTFKNARAFNNGFTIDESVWGSFKQFAEAKGAGMPTAQDEARSREWISVLIKAEIARLQYDNEAYFLVRMVNDNEVQTALKHFWK